LVVLEKVNWEQILKLKEVSRRQMRLATK